MRLWTMDGEFSPVDTLLRSAKVRLSRNVRNLSEHDIQQLHDAGMTLLAPLSGHSGDNLLPTYEGLTVHGLNVHIQFLALGQADELEARREYWAEVITRTAQLRHETWFQPILQSVDLGDICAVAVEPGTPLELLAQEERLDLDQAVSLLHAVAQALLTLGHVGIRPLRLRARDLVVAEDRTFRVSPFTEFSFTEGSGGRQAGSGPLEVILGLLSELSERGLASNDEVNLLSGITRSVSEGETGAYAVGDLILALDSVALRRLAGTQPAQGGPKLAPTTGPRWRPPAATSVPVREPRRNPRRLALALGLVGAFAALGFGLYAGVWKGGLGGGQEATPPSKRVSPLNRAVTDGTVIVNEKSLLTTLVTERFTRIAELSSDDAVTQFDGIAVKGGEVWLQSAEIVAALRGSGEELLNPTVELNSVSVTDRTTESMTVEVNYSMASQIKSADGVVAPESTVKENVRFSLLRSSDGWLLETATAID